MRASSGTLTVDVTMTHCAQSGGMIIQHFDFAVRDRVGPVYTGTTYFGFFTAAALDQYDIGRVGLNGRLATLQAAILLAKLPALDEEIERRAALARRYDEALEGVVLCPPPLAGDRPAWAQYTIRVGARDRLADGLRRRGIRSAVHYPRPLHRQPAYRSFPTAPDGLPVAIERVQAEARDSKRSIRDFEARMARHEAAMLAAAAGDGPVIAALEGWDQAGLKAIAAAIATESAIVIGGALALVEPACNTLAFHLHEKLWRRIERRRRPGATPALPA